MSRRVDDRGRALCNGKYADGSPCENLAKLEMTFDGIGYCGLHGNKIITHQEETKKDLARYREYQEVAFGAVVAPWPDEWLKQRKDELLRVTPSSELNRVRLDAETTAITRELERRRVGAR